MPWWLKLPARSLPQVAVLQHVCAIEGHDRRAVEVRGGHAAGEPAIGELGAGTWPVAHAAERTDDAAGHRIRQCRSTAAVTLPSRSNSAVRVSSARRRSKQTDGSTAASASGSQVEQAVGIDRQGQDRQLLLGLLGQRAGGFIDDHLDLTRHPQQRLPRGGRAHGS